jgi:hypothetical protein
MSHPRQYSALMLPSLNFRIGSHADFIYFDDFIAFKVPEAIVMQATA